MENLHLSVAAQCKLDRWALRGGTHCGWCLGGYIRLRRQVATASGREAVLAGLSGIMNLLLGRGKVILAFPPGEARGTRWGSSTSSAQNGGTIRSASRKFLRPRSSGG